MKIFIPPAPVPEVLLGPSVFLAGSIEMGVAIDWQTRVIEYLRGLDVNVLSPRRKQWDASWPQTGEFAPFKEQVEWELGGIERSTIVFLYFDPNTKSPISLLEMGLVLGSDPKKLIVCCPDGFYRQGNVIITCKRYGVEYIHKDLDSAVGELRKRIIFR